MEFFGILFSIWIISWKEVVSCLCTVVILAERQMSSKGRSEEKQEMDRDILKLHKMKVACIEYICREVVSVTNMLGFTAEYRIIQS